MESSDRRQNTDVAMDVRTYIQYLSYFSLADGIVGICIRNQRMDEWIHSVEGDNIFEWDIHI